MGNKKNKFLLAEIPAYLHQALKMQAVKSGMSMKALTAKALQKELKLKQR